MTTTEQAIIEVRKGQSNFDALEFVARARSDDAVHHAFWGVHIELCVAGNTVAVATDSRHMHFATVKNLEPGDYDVVSSKATSLILRRVPDGTREFPNWRRVIPQDITFQASTKDTSDRAQYDIAKSPSERDAGVSMLHANMVKISDCTTHANIHYLQALKGFGWYLAFDAGKRTYLLESSEGFTAVIAGMKFE